MVLINPINIRLLNDHQIEKPLDQTSENKLLPIPTAAIPPANENPDKNYQKWKEAGFPEKAYHQYPGLVDFVFNNNLHYMLEYYQKHDNKENHQIIFQEDKGAFDLF